MELESSRYDIITIMADTVTLSQSAYKNITQRLSRLEKALSYVVGKIDIEPPEGTEAWWEWSDKKALEDLKKGDYYELRSREDINDFFKHSDDEEYVYHKFHHKSKSAKAIHSAKDSKKAPETASALV